MTEDSKQYALQLLSHCRFNQHLFLCQSPEGYTAYEWLEDFQRARGSGLFQCVEELMECADLSSLRYHYTGKGENVFGDDYDKDYDGDPETTVNETEDFIFSSIQDSQSEPIVIKVKAEDGHDKLTIISEFLTAKRQGFFHPEAELSDCPDIEEVIMR